LLAGTGDKVSLMKTVLAFELLLLLPPSLLFLQEIAPETSNADISTVIIFFIDHIFRRKYERIGEEWQYRKCMVFFYRISGIPAAVVFVNQ
jgi:hypothetical protein